jgi:hypothetical protein
MSSGDYGTLTFAKGAVVFCSHARTVGSVFGP